MLLFKEEGVLFIALFYFGALHIIWLIETSTSTWDPRLPKRKSTGEINVENNYLVLEDIVSQEKYIVNDFNKTQLQYSLDNLI